MSKFILIQNVGVAPVEAFTLLGASNKSGTDAIGQFGSGTKLGTLALLRLGFDPIIYCGTTRLKFETRPIVFDGATHHRVFVRLSGKDQEGRSINRTEDLSVVLNYGKLDWTDPKLAIREYISNALDATGGNISGVVVKVVEESQLRASAEHTRIYVPYTEQTADIVDNLSTWFLQFNPAMVWRQDAIMEKATPSTARVYRRGVFVREVTHAPASLFDYNLNSLPMDEARVSQDWTVKQYASIAMRTIATPQQLSKVLLENKDRWEAEFQYSDEYDHGLYAMNPTKDNKEIRKQRWAEAFKLAIPDNGIVAGTYDDTTLADGKGYTSHRVSNALMAAATCYGLRTAAQILTSDEREGREVDAETNPLLTPAVEIVWNRLSAVKATGTEAFPEVRSFSQEMRNGGMTLGYCRDGVVYINNRIITADMGHELFATILEELAHHITKATDNSRDFQEFALSLAAKLLMGGA